MTFMRDTWIVFTRALRISVRNPVWLILGLLQPILYLALFGPLLERVSSVQGFGQGDAWQVFVPGLLIALAMFGSAFAGFGLVAEWRAGVIERMRVTPASRASLLVGRILRDVVVLFVQGLLLIVAAAGFGLRVPLMAVVVGLLLVAGLGSALAALSYAAALVLKSEDALAPLVNGLALPLMLLAGIFLPMTMAPRWLQVLSDFNPLKHIVDGVRAMFQGDLGASVALQGIAWTLGLLAIGVFVGTRTFQRENA